jgi:serine/threonine-protein kinase
MELLEGVSLEALVRRHGPQPAGRVIHILRQVCDSLEEAHADGLVHRDIKPANINLGRIGLRRDFVKVLDFGLVKAIPGIRSDLTSGLAGDDSLAGTTGLTPGTPAYMAPEMVQDGPVDGRADVYSLGCVAYFLLTGQPVFDGETAIQLLLKHLQQRPESPSRLAPDPVPPALESLVLACLAKQPDQRPTATELNRVLAEIDVDPWTEEHAERWWSAASGPAQSPAPVGAAASH